MKSCAAALADGLAGVPAGTAAFVAGVDLQDYIQHDYAVRFVDAKRGDYAYRPIVAKGTSYPTREPVARMVEGLPLGARMKQRVAFYPNGYHMLLFQNTTKMPYAVAAASWGHYVGCPQMNDKVFDALRTFTWIQIGFQSGISARFATSPTRRTFSFRSSREKPRSAHKPRRRLPPRCSRFSDTPPSRQPSAMRGSRTRL